MSSFHGFLVSWFHLSWFHLSRFLRFLRFLVPVSAVSVLRFLFSRFLFYTNILSEHPLKAGNFAGFSVHIYVATGRALSKVFTK